MIEIARTANTGGTGITRGGGDPNTVSGDMTKPKEYASGQNTTSKLKNVLDGALHYLELDQAQTRALDVGALRLPSGRGEGDG